MLPIEGYTVVPPPVGYAPARKPASKVLAAPGEADGEADESQGFTIPVATTATPAGLEAAPGTGVDFVTADGSTLPALKQDDVAFFGKLMDKTESKSLKPEEAKERRIMALLLKIKNGMPSQRKTALRQITSHAREFGAGPLFNQILPLLMSPTLEDQERHLLVKVVDRVLYRLDELVRPYTHKILVVIEPMLIDEDFYARVEAREIIANLSKAAGLPTMLSTIRPDIDNPDDYVRNATSRALAVVASALGVPSMLPFLKAVCQSRKTWYARHTGVKTVQQVAILLGCSILPFLSQLVEIIAHGLTDAQQKVRSMTALALASLAESAHPYGVDSFEPVLEPLWRGVRQHHGRTLASFLKAIGNIIPLMDDGDYASYFTKEVMATLTREFRSPDDDMRLVVLNVVKQCVGTDGVTAEYVRKDVCPEFFAAFWVRRSALDRRISRQLVDTAAELANKVGGAEVIGRIVDNLKDESEPLRRMTIECVMKVLENLGAADIGLDLEQRLVDGALHAFQEQAASVSASAAANGDGGGLGERESAVMLNGFGVIVNALGIRAKPYLPQIAGTIKFRLNNKDALVRGQSAELVSRIAQVMSTCKEDHLMAHLGVVLYESLGEEFPATLAAILAGLRGIVSVIGMKRMQPPIKDLVPRLTPILKNQNERVQENAIDLIGRIADRGAQFVSAREWMRICFELIEMLRAKKKSIRRASVSTFGFIAKAIGPSDILHVLLGNLRVQDRTMRVCTTVSLAIVAESCGPFTVLPALLNEYRVPDINVQNGCLKALSFMFEYIGPMSKDYIYAVVTLLEDALTDRDPVHRQTACTAVKHLALGVHGAGCEDALQHLLNFVWPNIFESSPHVIGAVFEAIEGLRVSLGPQRVFLYVLQGLFHPSRKVREVYWKIYNNLYVYSEHALVPVFPQLEDDFELDMEQRASGKLRLGARKKAVLKAIASPPEQRTVRNSYRRTHLDLFV